MAKEQKYFRKEVEEVDAILPFMSLLIIIIPMLLANLAFYHFHLISVSAPGASDPDSSPPEQKDSEKMVMAQLLIEPKIVKLDILDEENGESLKTIKSEASVETAQKVFDYLKNLKERYKKLDTILVTTHVNVLYEQLTNILYQLKQPIPTEEDLQRELAGEKLEENDGFRFKIVVLPASEELTI